MFVDAAGLDWLAEHLSETRWLSLPIGLFESIDWFKGKMTGKSYISWENLWFPIDFFLMSTH